MDPCGSLGQTSLGKTSLITLGFFVVHSVCLVLLCGFRNFYFGSNLGVGCIIGFLTYNLYLSYSRTTFFSKSILGSLKIVFCFISLLFILLNNITLVLDFKLTLFCWLATVVVLISLQH